MPLDRKLSYELNKIAKVYTLENQKDVSADWCDSWLTVLS